MGQQKWAALKIAEIITFTGDVGDIKIVNSGEKLVAMIDVSDFFEIDGNVLKMKFNKKIGTDTGRD